MTDILDAVKWIDLPTVQDERGMLTAIEGEQNIPFPIKRIFYVHQVQKDRGGHAHRDTDQVITCVSGSLSVQLNNGFSEKTFELNAQHNRGLYVPRMIFCELKNFSQGAVCLVLANTNYDMNRSLRSWQDYITVLKGN